ncbi:SDR family NAD(P)-dependent oxidoreductase [Acuticoccus sediminis]|uniref:SDR family NAD(P)-dependent oxidoreductase n=1 Tax=Acuticoccus sediminis TaxID=2184697 RepID=UPI001CFD0485|nr:SDR family oxidoreductase [Acuticoccus sediminis]
MADATDGEVPLVIVTGGLSGIGAATAAVLAGRGFRPVVFDIAGGATDGTAWTVWPDPVDVSDEDAVEAAVAAVEERHGPVAGLVNAAGILGRMHPPERLRMKDWDREMAVDLRGTFVMCRAVGPRMAARGGGSIVNIASVVGSSSAPVHGYAPAKAAVISLTATLAAEWGPKGVRVNAVSPGFTRTPALEAGLQHGVLVADDLIRGAALQRLVEPGEIGRVVAWLLGPDSSAVTGVNIPVDAGFLAGITWQAYGGLRTG